MDLTETFNEAANGGGEPEPAGQSEGPRTPSSPGTTPIPSGADRIPETVAANLSAQFNRPDPIPWEDPDLDDEEELTDDRGQRITQAQGELERLEQGRAEPTLENKLRPTRRLEQIVHTHEEEQREFRIAALRAYLEFTSAKLTHATRHTPHNDLEFSL